MKNYYLITCESFVELMSLEENLSNLNVRIIPKPLEISVGCDYGLRVIEDKNIIIENILNKKIKYKEIYFISFDDLDRKCEKIDLF